MQSALNIIAEEAKNLKEGLIQAILENGQNATGRTISQISELHGDMFVEIRGPAWIYQLQHGRRPTTGSGDGSLYDKILDWVKAKGVIFDDGIRNSQYTIEERTAKFLTYYIHKNGTYLFRNNETYNGTTNPILRVFSDERIQAIADRFTQEVLAEVSSDIFNALNAGE